MSNKARNICILCFIIVFYFSYSDKFKNQTKTNRIINFPNFNKTYEAEELWPFFKIRIPNVETPKIKANIEEEHLNKNNPAVLLKWFGEKSSSNPFQLITSAG